MDNVTTRKINNVQTVNTRALIESWHRINSAIASGQRHRIGVMKKQHLDLFDPADRALASQIFDSAVLDLSQDAAYIRAVRAERTLRHLDWLAAEKQKIVA